MAVKPTQFESWPAGIDPGYSPYKAVIQSITDGDTFRVLVDLGFNAYTFQSVRLMGVKAPELYTSDPAEKEKGRAAKAYLEALAPPGTKGLMRTDKDKTSFGRYVASFLLEGGVDLASAMVEAGHAEWSAG